MCDSARKYGWVQSWSRPAIDHIEEKRSDTRVVLLIGNTTAVECQVPEGHQRPRGRMVGYPSSFFLRVVL